MSKIAVGHDRLHRLILAPVVSEKSTRAAENNQYVFKVLKDAAKPEIKVAVEKLFSVKVVSVNTARVHGKHKRHGAAIAQRPDWKKAFVKLEEGNAIELF